MNAKGARQIVSSIEPIKTATALNNMAYWRSKGYLEALEGEEVKYYWMICQLDQKVGPMQLFQNITSR